MKTVCSLMLSCCAVVSASAGDSAEMRRDRLIFCSQFVIEDPYVAIFRDLTGFPDSTDYCCRFRDSVHDCHIYDWHESRP
jgi:hypothetical protein